MHMCVCGGEGGRAGAVGIKDEGDPASLYEENTANGKTSQANLGQD